MPIAKADEENKEKKANQSEMASTGWWLVLFVATAARARWADLGVQLCAKESRTFALDDFSWPAVSKPHRVGLADVELPTGTAATAVWAPGTAHFTLDTVRNEVFNLTLHVAVPETGETSARTVPVEVLLRDTAEGVCLVVTGALFCDTSPRNNVRDLGEAGMPHIDVMLHRIPTGGGAETLHPLRTNSRGEWSVVVRVPDETEWLYEAEYLFWTRARQ